MTKLRNVFFLFAAVSLLVACSSKEEDKTLKASTNTSIDKQEINKQTIDKVAQISGLVSSIENGKDGYIAQIYDQSGKAYAALVSIPNLGGPDNYTRFKVGDRVTIKGKIRGVNGDRIMGRKNRI